MHTTLPSPWRLPILLLAVSLFAGCGVTTKKNFLGEPVQETAGSVVPVSSGETAPHSPETLSRKPGLDSAEATGVQKLLNIITPYRINIQQGNFISQEMLARVQTGMTPEQVRFALGTPLLSDIFHAGRWDYVFRLQKPNGQVTNNRVIIYFEDNRVARILSDPLPDETQYLQTIAGPAPKKAKAETGGDKNNRQQTENTAGESVTVLPAATPSTLPDETAPQTAEPVREADPLPMPSYETQPAKQETLPVRQSAAGRTPVPDTKPETAVPAAASGSHAAPVTSREMPPPRETPPPPAAEKTGITQAEPAPVMTPPKKAAVTVQAPETPDEPDEDFSAAPNSAMQLHELMQPQ